MLGWAVALAIGAVSGAAVALLVRRERTLDRWLRNEMSDLKDEVGQTCLDVRALASCRGQDMPGRVDGDDSEIADNLSRMNSLLDQLNGLLKGKKGADVEARRIIYRERKLPGVFDFVSPEELQKFEALPPISDEEILSIDWDYLFKRISSDQC